MMNDSHQTQPEDDQAPFMARLLAEYRRRMLHPINLSACFCGSMLFAFIGPYGTYAQDPLLFRILFWSLIVWSSSFLATFLGVWAGIKYDKQPFWFQSAVGATLFSILYFAFIWNLLRSTYDHSIIPHPLELFLVIISISTFVYIGMWVFAVMLEQQIRPLPEPPTQTNDRPTSPANPIEIQTEFCHAAFLARLGPNAGTRLIRLAMSDHYIEAHTETGMHLMYLRFADAIEELKSANGAQVHRSHWVCFGEIASVAKTGAKVGLVMSDGATVPISRSRKKDLQSRGLI